MIENGETMPSKRVINKIRSKPQRVRASRAYAVALGGSGPSHLPEKRPRSAKWLGSLGWIPGMASSRFDSLYVSQTRDRAYWILWLEWDDEDGKEIQIRAYMRADGQDMESVAAKLIACAYRSEEAECDELGIPHQVVPGELSEERWNAIINNLWI